jgi:hypothetical protein
VILGIDPGTTESGWMLYEPGRPFHGFGICMNDDVLALRDGQMLTADELAIEMIASQGMAVGASTFQTCVWIGRFIERWASTGRPYRLIYRHEVKMHICGHPRAKDANIRQALIDRFGEPGKKSCKGPTYGISKHVWPALAVAVTYDETRDARPA